MTFRIRHFGLIVAVSVFATVVAWFVGFIPLIYLMPIAVLYILLMSLACPRCNRSPFIRKYGAVSIGWPFPGDTCSNCGFPFRDGLRQ